MGKMFSFIFGINRIWEIKAGLNIYVNKWVNRVNTCQLLVLTHDLYVHFYNYRVLEEPSSRVRGDFFKNNFKNN